VKRSFFIVSMFLCLFSVAVADPQMNDNGLISKLSPGVNYLFNMEMEKAETVFRQGIKDNPNDPLAYYYLAQMYLWDFFGNSSTKEYNKFIQYSDIAIEKANELNKVKGKEEYASLILGCIYTQRSVAYSKTEHYLDMITASQKSRSYLNDVVDMNKSNYDVYLGFGLFKFALTQVPPSLKWALNAIGYEGDLKQSIHEVRLSATKGVLTKIESNYYLAQLLCDQQLDYDAAINVYESLLKNYPGNFLFSYSYGIALMKDRHPDKAAPVLQNLTRTVRDQFKQIKAYAYFSLADIRFHQNRFKEAKVLYESFIAMTPDKGYTGIANYRLALCLAALGDYNYAKSSMEKAKYGILSLEDDAFAKSRASMYQSHWVSNEDLTLLRYGNLIEAGKVKESVDSLEHFYSYVKTWRMVQECRYYLSEAYYTAGNYKSSLAIAYEALKYGQNTDKWVVAYCYFNAIRANLKMGNSYQAKELEKKLDSLEDYDYAKKLKIMLNSLKMLYNLS
jgi:tetratricopeptide (TPR) repeat protein